MKAVFTSVFQDDAVVVQSILRACGIEATLLADRMMDVNPYFVTDIKGVSVLVTDDKIEEAEAIVADYKRRAKGEPSPTGE